MRYLRGINIFYCNYESVKKSESPISYGSKYPIVHKNILLIPNFIVRLAKGVHYSVKLMYNPRPTN